MGTYYYLNNKNTGESWPIYEDDFVHTLYSIAKKHGLIITDEMIYNEVNNIKVDKRVIDIDSVSCRAKRDRARNDSRKITIKK